MNLALVQGEYETGLSFVFSLIYLALVFWVAKKNQFFRLPAATKENPVTFFYVFGVFFTYLVFAFFILPLVYVLIAYINTGNIHGFRFLSSTWLGWVQLGSLCALFCVLIAYCFLIKPEVRRTIFWQDGAQTSSRFWKSVGMGVVGWFVSYPFVLLVSLVSNWMALKLWGESKFEQVAVKQLKSTMNHPLLFALMIAVVAVLVPIMEELLFRGFLQNLLKRYFGRRWAIIVTALIFAAVHFSTSQGHGNFQLISSLTVLALFLGFIYEREKTLWAPMALHTTFNAFSILMITLSSK